MEWSERDIEKTIIYRNSGKEREEAKGPFGKKWI
jgi:hypothetical protein